jgi:hypothetical protein
MTSCIFVGFFATASIDRHVSIKVHSIKVPQPFNDAATPKIYNHSIFWEVLLLLIFFTIQVMEKR